MGLVGVDEAGKGPVLGSMFAAAVRTPEREILPAGIQDSKALSPTRREELADALRADPRIQITTTEITPRLIDDPGTDMNTLTVEAHAEVIEALADESVHVTADASDVDADRFARRIQRRIPGVAIDAIHEADTYDIVVGAASIVAKVERDAHIERLSERYGDIGSGYPNDPTTRAFLERYGAENGTLPPCARSTWATSNDLLEALEQSALDEF